MWRVLTALLSAAYYHTKYVYINSRACWTLLSPYQLRALQELSAPTPTTALYFDNDLFLLCIFYFPTSGGQSDLSRVISEDHNVCKYSDYLWFLHFVNIQVSYDFYKSLIDINEGFMLDSCLKQLIVRTPRRHMCHVQYVLVNPPCVFEAQRVL